MSEFFPRRPGLAVFLNAGDPPLDVLGDVVRMLDERGVDCLELAVPFPDSVTDGPVIRRSADRALAAGIGLGDVLDFIRRIRGELRTLRIAVFADWSHTVRPSGVDHFVRQVAQSGAHGVLLHGASPRVRPTYHDLASDAELAVVTTCYSGSPPSIVAEAAAHASAYVYLVARYGTSGTATAPDPVALRPAIAALHSAGARAPIAVGFGVRTAIDVDRVHQAGADAAIVGSAVVACVERSIVGGADVVDALARLVSDLHPAPNRLSGVCS